MNETNKSSLSLRVGTFNIHHGKDVSFDMSVIAHDILDMSLDIVGIQEADEGVRRSGGIRTMSELTRHTGYNALHFKTMDYGGGEYGIGILSRYPIISYKSIPLFSGGLEPRVVAHAILDIDGTRLDFFNTHLTHNSKEVQKRQFCELAELLSVPKSYILTGDFNTSRLEDFEPLKGATLVNNGQFKSYPESESAIDNICYSADFSVISSSMLEIAHSDHRLVYAQIVK